MVAKRSLGLKIKQTTRLDNTKEAKWKSLSHGCLISPAGSEVGF